jgi:methanogenic corrinoid protein MtbC1
MSVTMTENSVGQSLLAAYLEPLLAGERVACRQTIERAFSDGCGAAQLLTDLIWPAMERIQALYREDRITQSSLNLATRLNRSITDQLAARLDGKASNGRSALVFCGHAEPEELGGQITADLFEADGWQVRFAGGGVPEDEVLKLIGDLRPDLLILFATLPSAMPAVRRLIDYLRQVNSCPQMQILCCGGIYKRAEGLAEEIGADLYAPDAASALVTATENPTRRATVDQQTVGRTRRIRKAAARKATAEVKAGE